MEVIIASAFSILIVLNCVVAMMKVLSIAEDRKEISRIKRMTYSTIVLGAGIAISAVIPSLYSHMYPLLVSFL
ncbi:hypothetical protein EQV77_04220 [Halobacillus fulvus]|nr:hypothetical protein EQV77_04220 [Halobacillus fulvus]